MSYPKIRPNTYLSVRASNPIVAKSRKSRSTGKRTRTGCRTCKQRRVKCDETKPACSNCERFGRKCGGYDEDLLVKVKQFTMPHKAGYFAAGFWSHLVTKLCNEAVESAFNALAMSQSSKDPPSQPILEQYSSAIDSLNKVILRDGSDSIEAIMACSLAFASLEALFGNNRAATSHIIASLRLYKATRKNSIFDDLSVMLATVPDFSDSDYCSWRLACELEITLTDLAEEVTPEIDALFLDEINNDSWYFPSNLVLQNAEHALMILGITRRRLRCLMRHAAFLGLDPASPQRFSDLEDQHRHLREALTSLKTPFETLFSKNLDRGARRDVLIAKLGYLTQVFIMEHMFSGSKDDELISKRVDDILEVVVAILQITPSIDPAAIEAGPSTSSSASNTPITVYSGGSPSSSSSTKSFSKREKSQLEKPPSYCLSSALVPCLFHVSKVAPSLQSRQKAIDILSRLNAVEGILSSNRCAKVAKKLLDVDTSDLGLVIDTSRRDKLGRILPVDVDRNGMSQVLPKSSGAFLMIGRS